jgi:hypothetical protein
VDGGVDPATTLREENLPVVGRDGVRVRVTDELGLERGEVLEEERREVPILSEVQQVLHVQRVDAVLGVVLDELVRDEERLVGVGGAQAVERETTGQACNGAEQAFERLGHVVRDEVLVDLEGRE